ncbi:MAG: peptidase domain-containing ABC transporter [Thermovirga sp.]
MNFRSKFPFYRQYEAMDCGPTCLRMIAKFHGRSYSLSYLRDKCSVTREGSSLLDLYEAAEAIGLRGRCVLASLAFLASEARLPCIVHWDRNHFVVVYKIKDRYVHIADPAFGRCALSEKDFLARWADSGTDGYVLLLEPTEKFLSHRETEEPRKGLLFLFSYLRPYLQLLSQIGLAMLLGSAIQLVLPFLTRMIVDRGIGERDVGLMKLILLGQFVLILGRTCAYFLREWILFYISTPINITLVHDFLMKLTKLPLGYFDTKKIGDTLQRLNDHQRVESFITHSVLGLLFTVMNLAVFGVVLAIYSTRIFLIFLAGTFLYFLWIRIFLSRRREIDFLKFRRMGKSQNAVIQMIMGMQEIRLNRCERKKTADWMNIQESLYETGLRSMSLVQTQQLGCTLLQETQYILITYLAAVSVISGGITLGTMLAIQFILGQLRGPVDQLLRFIGEAQDARISFERIEDIHTLPNEENEDDAKEEIVPETADIAVDDVSFRYGGPHSETVLKDVSIVIPSGRTTALVGTSGSGKTTLLKLLLGVYRPVEGTIRVGDTSMSHISLRAWRDKCGVVMQDGYIFSDTIADNISLTDGTADEERVLEAARAANIDDFIQTLPLKYRTMIGLDGHGLSQGQKQRILIARAVYKDPRYVFFDEATNSLDTRNESIIMNNLERFFAGKTVIVVAHRLSTVKNADLIVVLDRGIVVETGRHEELIAKKGAYYSLVGNQLGLGS